MKSLFQNIKSVFKVAPAQTRAPAPEVFKSTSDKSSPLRKFVASLSVFALLAPSMPVFAAATVATTTTVASAANPVAVGTPVVLTATVTTASGTGPTGTVTFKKGTTTLGTGTLSGTGLTRTATFSATFTTVAANSITAVYGGNSTYKTSTSTALTLNSQKADTTTSVTSSANPSNPGASVTFTATVVGYTPTGTVTFKDGATTLGTGTLAGTGNTRTATYATTALSAGTHSITAVYAGNTLNNTSTSAALSQVVSLPAGATTTTVAAAANPVAVGVEDVLTATVTAGSGAGPTGTVTFKSGATTLGTGTLSGTGLTRTATFSATFTTVAANSITAVYAGDGTYTTSTSSALSVTSQKVTPTNVVTSSLNPSASGESVTFTSTVTGYNPTGTVTFKDGGTTLGTGTLSGTGSTKTATYVKSNLTIATHSITAVYAGDTLNNTVTSAALSQVVTAALSPTTTDLTSSVNPLILNGTTKLTASVSPFSATGSVIFKDGAITIGTAALGVSLAGVATLDVSNLAAGSHSITAVYSGDSAYASSTSNVVDQKINLVAAATLSATPAVLMEGQSVQLKAVMNPSTATGMVTFKNGANILGVNSIASGVATLDIASMAAGAYSLTAEYSGDDIYGVSASNTFNLTVTAVKPMTQEFGYDANGNATIVKNGFGTTTNSYYDNLNRKVQVQQPEATVTSFGYDLADNLTQVVDPRNLATTYSPDGLGQVKLTSSPDTGAASATFNADGSIASVTDARGKATTMSYDILKRLTQVSYPTGVATTLEYDGGAAPYPGATGSLTKFSDESGNQVFAYDAAGRLTSKTQTTNGKVFVVGYAWGDTGSALDKVTSVTYPSGNRVNYAYDAYGAVSAITVDKVGANGTGTSGNVGLLSNVTLNALGAITSWTWSSGLTQDFGFDAYNLLSSYKLGNPNGTGASAGVLRTVGHDAIGRITGYTHTNNGAAVAALDQAFTYDNLDRMTATTLGGVTTSYNFDATGNRTSKVVNGTTYTNTISATSNRQVSVQDVGGTFNVTYDAAGHVTSDGVNTYTYSDRGRMSQATTAGGTVNYLYNALDQRVYKAGSIVPSGEAYFVYDESGKILGEYDAAGVPVYETIYLGNAPVGVIKQTGTAGAGNIDVAVYNVSADHLGAARVITRQSDEAVVWRWDSAESYGGSGPDQNPNGLGTFVYNARFPGQTFDAETGLFQNMRREYNPRIGRYMQSDPIGLAGGINTYEYVNGNPVALVDPTGEIGMGDSFIPPGAVGGKVSTVNSARNPVDSMCSAVSNLSPSLRAALNNPATSAILKVLAAANNGLMLNAFLSAGQSAEGILNATQAHPDYTRRILGAVELAVGVGTIYVTPGAGGVAAAITGPGATRVTAGLATGGGALGAKGAIDLFFGDIGGPIGQASSALGSVAALGYSTASFGMTTRNVGAAAKATAAGETEKGAALTAAAVLEGLASLNQLMIAVGKEDVQNAIDALASGACDCKK